MEAPVNHMRVWIDQLLERFGVEDRTLVAAVVWAIGQYQTPDPRPLAIDAFWEWTAHVRSRADCPPFMCWSTTHILVFDMDRQLTCVMRPSVWEQRLQQETSA